MADYFDLVNMPTFSTSDVANLTGNLKSAQSLLRRLMAKGLVKKVRSQLYAPVQAGTDQVIASKYQIATAINQNAYVSHHTALEYYGLANQVFYEVYVSSPSRFQPFDFEAWTFKHVPSRFSDGVVSPPNSPGVRITDLERTIVDNIKDFERIGGLGELLYALSSQTYLDSEGLLRYLNLYDSQVLYQKTGYFLEDYRDALKLKDGFFEECRIRMGKSTRYLESQPTDDVAYVRRWQLVVPRGLLKNGDDTRA